MFEGSLYTISQFETTEKTIVAQIELNENHEVFKGHFPEMPILPGVCTLQIIKELVAKHTNKVLVLKSGDTIKFTGLINPQQQASLLFEIAYTELNNLISVNCSIKTQDAIVLKMKTSYTCN